uniref:Uncharacterized protein n=1 Tax=Knipowitschia caucasica TaxID=637954 RepID=A0AAV2KW65_KNICA
MAMLLKHQDFKFFLELFHHIMPLVDLLYAKLQKKNIDAVHIKRSIQQFAGHTKHQICNTILRHTRERFNFTDHLVCATLLQGDKFEEHHGSFPEEVLQSTLKAYPMLNGSKLKTELSLIYSKAEFRACCGAVDLFQLFMENNLKDVFSETVTLLKILITTPMTTAEAESASVSSAMARLFFTPPHGLRLHFNIPHSVDCERVQSLFLITITLPCPAPVPRCGIVPRESSLCTSTLSSRFGVWPPSLLGSECVVAGCGSGPVNRYSSRVRAQCWLWKC